MNLFHLTGLLLIAIVGIYFWITSFQKFIKFMIFTSPFAFFGINVGFVLTPAKLLGIFSAFKILIVPTSIKFFKKSSIYLFLPYIFYVLCLTAIMQFNWPTMEHNLGGWLYGNEGRALNQIFQLIIGLSISLLVISYCRTIKDFEVIIRCLLYSMLIMGVWGLYVFFAQLYGLPFPSINRADGLGTTLAITTDLADAKVPRAYSLSGEPKGLASDMVLAMSILIFSISAFKVNSFVSMYRYPLAIFCFIVLLLTLSTAGFIQFPLAIGIGLIIISKFSFKIRISTLKTFFVILLLIASFYYIFSDILKVIFDERLVGRITDRGGIGSYADDAMIEAWRNDPLLFLNGAGLGGSNFYIREINPDQYIGKVAAPRGIIGFIGDRGLIGLIFFCFPILICFWKLNKLSRFNKYKLSSKKYIALLTAFYILFLTKQGWFFEWILIALTVALSDISSRIIMKESKKNI